MSDDNKKTIYMMDWLNAELAKRGHKNFQWVKPEDVLPHLQIVRNAVLHNGRPLQDLYNIWSADTPLPLRDAAGKVVPIHPAVAPAMTEEDDIEDDDTEEDDILRASGIVTFRPAKSARSPVRFYSSGADDDHSEKCGGSPPPQRIELPPGYVMERVTRCLFFFALTRPREFEEIVGDYEYNMIEAEAKGATAGALWLLRLKYWGAYLYTLAVRLPAGIVGKIIRTLTGG